MTTNSMHAKTFEGKATNKVTPNEVQQTLLDQLTAMDKMWYFRYGVDKIVLLDANTVRFHIRNENGIFNVDVHYNKGHDLYDVKGYKISARPGLVARSRHRYRERTSIGKRTLSGTSTSGWDCRAAVPSPLIGLRPCSGPDRPQPPRGE